MLLTLACALVPAAAGGAPGGVFTLSIDSERPVSELKEAVKRKKPQDLRRVDADRLVLFPAVHNGSWLSDEAEAALVLEAGGVHDDIRAMLERAAPLRATKPVSRYFLDGGLPVPGQEQIHVLVVAPAVETKRALDTEESGRTSKKSRWSDDEEGDLDLVVIVDSESEQYPDPPRRLPDAQALYRRMGKQFSAGDAVGGVEKKNDEQSGPLTALFAPNVKNQGRDEEETEGTADRPILLVDDEAHIKSEIKRSSESAPLVDRWNPSDALMSSQQNSSTATPEPPAVPNATDEAPSIVFSEEQNEFIKMAVQNRQNLLLVAPAGYGKSAVIKTIIELFGSMLSSVDNQPVCGLCAPTGRAASLIKGRTIHSYLGIGLGRGPVREWVKRVTKAQFLKTTLKALRSVQVIIIDEISMVSAQFLDKISTFLQEIRHDRRPFGGVQMILVGDLCQLPPVEGHFMFRSAEYERAVFRAFRFNKNFRQNDPEFIDLLNEVRFGRCSDKTFATLASQTSIEPEYANGLKPMMIVSTNAEVDTINERELYNMSNNDHVDILTYKVRISPYANPKKAEAYRKSDGIPEQVKLTVGCQIVVTQNLGGGLVNGTQGCVLRADAKMIEIRLQDNTPATIEYFAYKDPEQPDVFLARTLFSYMPVRLGYASTVHKAQGMTLQLLEVDLKRTFAHGQLYTAVSRVTDLRGLRVKNLSRGAFICDEKVCEFYERL